MRAEHLLKPRLMRLVVFRQMEERARLGSTRVREELLLFIAVEATNLWTQFCKSYAIRSARGMTSLSGARWRSPTVGGLSSEEIRAHLVITHGNGRRRPSDPLNEPTWRKLDIVERCCTSLDVGNQGSIARAISYGSSFTSELPEVRNFAAHKCENTRLRLDRIAARRGYPSKADLSHVMLSPSSSGFGTVALEWLTEMERTMKAMCT